jgi:hypothetical protein
MAKVFIKSDQLTHERPIIVASYADDTVIADDAHGPGLTVMTVPNSVLGGPAPESLGMSSLIPGWREKVGSLPVKAEARRRIERSFSISDQLNVLHDMVDAITRHGADPNKWPADVRQRKQVYDEGRRYIADVREKARGHAVMPRDPASDKAWPQRMTRKV